MHRRTGGPRRWSWLTAAVARRALTVAGQRRSCTGFPPWPRDRPGSGPHRLRPARELTGVGRDRCRAGTLGECISARQRPDRGTPWPGWCWAIAAAALRAARAEPGLRGARDRHLLARRRGPRARRSVPARVPRAARGRRRVRAVPRRDRRAHRAQRHRRAVHAAPGHDARLLGGFTVGGTVESSVVLQAVASSFAVVGMMAVFGAVQRDRGRTTSSCSRRRARSTSSGWSTTVALAFVPVDDRVGAARCARPTGPAPAGGRSGGAGCCAASCRCSNAAWNARWRSRSRWTRAGSASAARRAAEAEAGWCALRRAARARRRVRRARSDAPTRRRSARRSSVGIVALGHRRAGAGSRGDRRQHYRHRPMTAADWVLVAVVAARADRCSSVVSARRQRHAHLVHQPAALADVRPAGRARARAAARAAGPPTRAPSAAASTTPPRPVAAPTSGSSA